MSAPGRRTRVSGGRKTPIVLSTWKHGIAANEAAWEVLTCGGSALDAVEAGVRVTESDPGVRSVGYGGYPDEECVVTLDASIMGPDGNAGAVAFMRGYKHPVSVARAVMEKTRHVMLAGEGAEEFADRQGFEREELLTDESRKRWLKWHEKKSGDRAFPEDSHDTIGMVAMDARGDLAGACTTSGLAFRMHGRVGDSPVIGAGLYVDNEVGAASATGRGEAIMKVPGSFLAVELMRGGNPPEKACRMALERIIEKHGGTTDFQAAIVAVNRSGEAGAYSVREGFEYALAADGKNELLKSGFLG